MRKISMFAMAALSVLLAGGALAQKPGKMTPGVMGHKMPMAGKMVSYTGMVKGAPAGGSFTLATRSASYTVTMAKGGRARDKSTGKFVGVANIKPGSSVTAVGTLAGTTLTAKSVTVNSAPGGKMTPGKMTPGKMNKMGK